MKTRNLIIVAGGSGSRMKSEIPKQFIVINNLPIVMHTINLFYQFDKNLNIVLVLPENQIEYWCKLVEKYNFKIKTEIAKGGNTRFESVKSGLAFVKEGIVGIHDAVRPFVSLQTIQNAYDTAVRLSNAIPVVAPNESLRIIDNISNKHIDRKNIRIVQTPQCFEANLLKNAYNQPYSEVFTDDASVVEKFGASINLTEGNIENIKITTPFDLKIAEVLLNN